MRPVRQPAALGHGDAEPRAHLRYPRYPRLAWVGRLLLVLAFALTACDPASSADAGLGKSGARPVPAAATHAETGAPQEAPGWMLCAAEHGVCRFSGKRVVRYGTAAQYVVLTLSGDTRCDNTVFGDPAPSLPKRCWYAASTDDAGAGAAPSRAPSRSNAPFSWTPCAAENGRCAFAGSHAVKYGTDTQYVILQLSGGSPCNNGVFGDPAPGKIKHCWYDSETATSAAAVSSPVPLMTAASATTAALTCGGPSQPVNTVASGDMIEADTPGSDGTRMFAAGRPFVLTFTTRANSSDTLAWQIVDAWSNVRASGQFAVASGPQIVSLDCVSTLAGYFAVSATLSSAGVGLHMRGTRPNGIATFGVLPDLAGVLPAPTYTSQDQHRFGGQGGAFLLPGQTCCTGDGYRPLFPDLGLSWTNDTRNWFRMEPNGPNTFNPSTYPLAQYFRQGDLMRLILLDGLPGWASPTGVATHSYAPKSLADYTNFMTRVGQESNAVRARYFPKQAKNYYQVTWEPDYQSGLPWKDTDANFVAMYRATWQGIHATDPNAVVMGTTNASVDANTQWLRRLAPLGIGQYLDGVTIHGYYDIGTSPSHPPERLASAGDASQALPAQMRALRMQMAGMLKPGARLFATETGISYDLGTRYGPGYPTPNVLYAQGAVVARTHLILLGEGADVSYVFFATDFPDQIGYGLFFDLTSPQGSFGPGAISPKPAALAVAAMTRIIDGTSTLGPVNGVPAGVYAYAFQQLNNGDVITALWAHDNAAWNTRTGFSTAYHVGYNLQVDAPGTSGQVVVLDMMGNPTSVNYANGVAPLTLSETPVYVISTNAAVAKANVTTPAGYLAQ